MATCKYHRWVAVKNSSPPQIECTRCGHVDLLPEPEVPNDIANGSFYMSAEPRHKHVWIERTSMTGQTRRECRECGSLQNLLDKLYTDPRGGFMDTVGESGGIVDYDDATGLVTIANGSKIQASALLRANPSVKSHELRAELLEVANKTKRTRVRMEILETLDPSGISTANVNLLADEILEGRFQKPTSTAAPVLTGDAALTFIVELIKHDEDPFIAAGQWLTKMTNAITEVTRGARND